MLLPSTDLYVTGTKYNAPLINAMVLYVGVYAVQLLQSSTNKAASITQGAPMDIFQRLVRELDTEGKFINYFTDDETIKPVCRPLPFIECNNKPATISKQPYPLL
jgi:hypothetical protein